MARRGRSSARIRTRCKPSPTWSWIAGARGSSSGPRTAAGTPPRRERRSRWGICRRREGRSRRFRLPTWGSFRDCYPMASPSWLVSSWSRISWLAFCVKELGKWEWFGLLINGGGEGFVYIWFLGRCIEGKGVAFFLLFLGANWEICIHFDFKLGLRDHDFGSLIYIDLIICSLESFINHLVWLSNSWKQSYIRVFLIQLHIYNNRNNLLCTHLRPCYL